ncbi:hypothetical protein H8B09_10135 [Paenibacillus sp. PR3]|uniref:Lipoprotein n=1 Tax=Paenibacillus terricola TaxID=2763503 RepID=A0ABR8MT67_9BACL|nr:hypothetical protein [Paenibacillus terricola]MBD3919113.1 hypothetical protein [Paenibacillus terricola]
MKKIILTLIAMCFITTGCFGADKASEERNRVPQQVVISLTLEDVTEAIKAEGLELIPVATLKNDWILSNVEPNRFRVGKPNENTDPAKLDQFSIYVFESENERKKGLDDFNKQKEAFDMIVPLIYEAKNVMMIYWSDAYNPNKFGQQFQDTFDRLRNK